LGKINGVEGEEWSGGGGGGCPGSGLWVYGSGFGSEFGSRFGCVGLGSGLWV
jgi:hypothetical protein